MELFNWFHFLYDCNEATLQQGGDRQAPSYMQPNQAGNPRLFLFSSRISPSQVLFRQCSYDTVSQGNLTKLSSCAGSPDDISFGKERKICTVGEIGMNVSVTLLLKKPVTTTPWLTKPIFGIKYTPPYEMPKWRNWQTRYVQGVVRVPSCGFKSHLRHQNAPERDSLKCGSFCCPSRPTGTLPANLGRQGGVEWYNKSKSGTFFIS